MFLELDILEGGLESGHLAEEVVANLFKHILDQVLQQRDATHKTTHGKGDGDPECTRGEGRAGDGGNDDACSPPPAPFLLPF